jgi:2-oxoglutarate ferredoxin oxidoreductase subunit gamma
MQQEEFLFAGFGGQGVMFVGQLLAYAAMDEGLEVTWIPSYGPEMRGGTAHCFVVISEKIVGNPRTVLAFNNPSFEKYDPLVAPGGLLASNASMIARHSTRTDIRTLEVPATSIADELGNMRITNLVMLGAVLEAHPVLPLDAIKRALKEHIPSHHRDMLSLNYEALERGAAFAASTVKA